jgi:hypothetical protein
VASSSHTPPLVEEETPFHKNIKLWREQKYCHGYRRGLKSRTIVLARAIINFLDWSGHHHPHCRCYCTKSIYSKHQSTPFFL